MQEIPKWVVAVRRYVWHGKSIDDRMGRGVDDVDRARPTRPKAGVLLEKRTCKQMLGFAGVGQSVGGADLVGERNRRRRGLIVGGNRRWIVAAA